MSKSRLEQWRVLAVDPTSRGFGFVLLEGPSQLIDWGVSHACGDKYTWCLTRITHLIDLYSPEVIVIENSAGSGSRRTARVRQLLREIQALAMNRDIPTRRYSRSELRQAFSKFGARTKYQIAKAIVGSFPELASRLPPFRKPWMCEDDRMSIFDALGLALAMFHFEHRPNKPSRARRN
jgi:Holliday junction resolvasome RuvABC endonuclease subunit